jgi:hypothetical protein
MNSADTSPLEFIGIYDADSTLVGEISYWIGARLGRAHCSLCELTHGLFTTKSEWKACQSALGIPFLTFHRNDAPSDALNVAAGQFPIVLARYSHGLEIVFTKHQLDEFQGDTQTFEATLHSVLSKI